MVISQNPELGNLYAEYEKSKDTTQFIQNLKSLSNGTLNTNEDDQTNINTLLSSPEDSRLVKRKKAKAKKIESKAPEMFGGSVQSCEEGMSPKITFTKRKYQDDEYEQDDSD